LVKEFLSREGHPFVVKNIEEDDAAYDELIKLGARAVPTIVIAADDPAQDDQVITGFDQARLRAALSAAGGGSSPDR
jgi:hypothetical protein